MQERAIDILVPTYNSKPDYLCQAIESALSQTEQRWNMFIHDESPEVNVRAMVEKYLDDPRIHFTHSDKRLGIGGNWNAALKVPTTYNLQPTTYIQYLFDDDWWEPTYLEKAMNILEQNPSVGLTSIGHSYVYEGEISTKNAYEALVQFKEKHIEEGHRDGKEFLRFWLDHGLHPNVIGEPSFVMIRRSALEQAGNFSETMPQFLDVDMWIRLLLVSDWFNCTENLGSFRVHLSGTSARNEALGVGITDRLECFERLIGRLQGNDKAAATRARNRAVEKMVQKYFDRKAKGKKMEGAKNGALKTFAMKHPLLIGSAILKAKFQNK